MHWLIHPAYAIGVLLLSSGLCHGDEAPASIKAGNQTRIRISKETTYLTEPLDTTGHVDFVEAINRKAAEGITPDINFEVIVRQVMGVGAIDASVRKEYCRRLGVAEPSKSDQPIRSYGSFLDARFGDATGSSEVKKKR